jgi:MoxR-like ATPase
MLPEAALVFLDELLNANSAVLNSLLMVLNERIFRRGRETRPLPLLLAVGASNYLPEDEALAALFDRFLVRVPCQNVPQEQLQNVLHAGWELDRAAGAAPAATVSVAEIGELQSVVRDVDVTRVRPVYVELVQRLRHAGISVSDRRAVKFQRLMAASALLAGRMAVEPSDLWTLRYTWDTEEQQEVLATLVGETLRRHEQESAGPRHPRSSGDSAPDPEALARDLDRIGHRLENGGLSDGDRSYLRDQLSVLAGRCEWVAGTEQRDFLKNRVGALRQKVGAAP